MFNIGTVSRMTNILEATLRVWERRYGFPNSTRTSGGHRLYTPEDITRLQWVKERVDEGMQVSNAIRMLRAAEEQGAFASIDNASDEERRPMGGGLLHLQSRLYKALIKHQLEEASLILVEAQALYPLEEIVLEIIAPTLRQIGAAWQRGEADVATEHLATNHLRYFLSVWMHVGPPSVAIHPVVLACAPGELHEGSLLMLGVLLRRLRWPVHYLGQAMPLPALSRFIEEIAPPLIVFAAMTAESAHALAAWPTWLPKATERNHPLICYGGQPFVEQPELVKQVQGHYLGNTLQEGVQTLDTLLHQLNPLLHTR